MQGDNDSKCIPRRQVLKNNTSAQRAMRVDASNVTLSSYLFSYVPLFLYLNYYTHQYSLTSDIGNSGFPLSFLKRAMSAT